MRYLLDANAVIALLNDPRGRVSMRLRGLPPAAVAVSAIVLHQLYFSAYKSARREQKLALVDALRFAVPALDTEDARHVGEVRDGLAALGVPIGAYDVLIAGQGAAVTRPRARPAEILRVRTRGAAPRPETWR